jgi:glucokinase
LPAPPIFVIGGGVAEAGEILRAPVEKAFLERLVGRRRRSCSLSSAARPASSARPDLARQR